MSYNPNNAATLVKSLRGTSGKPTAVAGSGAGVSPTITVADSSNNVSGQITFVQGTGAGVGSGPILVLTLADGVAAPNDIDIFFTPANANFASINDGLFVTTTKTTVTLQFNGIAPSAGMTYIGKYGIVLR